MTQQPPTPRPFHSSVPHHHDVLHTPAEILAYLSTLFPHWHAADITITRVQGGITNTIFSARDAAGGQVLVRVFGSRDVFAPADRARENLVFEQLGAAAVAPRLLAVFANGRVEAWLRARPIALPEMTSRPVCVGLASKMAALHRFRPVGVRVKGRLWEVLEGWVRQVVAQGTVRPFERVDVGRCVACLNVLKEQLVERDSPIVFCHNDLLFGNIMLADNGEVHIIDFEYSSYNYRGFDIGNFFCEAMGGTVDGYVDSTKYPSETFRIRFCTTYLEESGVEPTKERVTSLVQEAEDYGLVSHMYWGFWALTQHASSTVDFPYLKFAENRFAEFFKRFTQPVNEQPKEDSAS